MSVYNTQGLGAPAGKIVSGTKAIGTAGTAVQVVTASTPCIVVFVAADLGNTNPIVVGDSSVDASSGSMQGIILVPGNASIPIHIDNLNKLWVDSQTSGDDLCFAYLQPFV